MKVKELLQRLNDADPEHDVLLRYVDDDFFYDVAKAYDEEDGEAIRGSFVIELRDAGGQSKG